MRGKQAEKREQAGDTVYRNRMVAKLINRIMRDGKKSIAETVVYRAFDLIKKQDNDPLLVFEKAVQNIGPKQEVKPRRVGGASYQIPIEVRGDRRIALAIRWLITAARSRANREYHTFSEKLAAEIKDASNNLGNAIKKRDSVQKMADANRAFAHFRW